jgi:hypothetical protein
MKSKQLANVLLKIPGLYVCLLAIPSCVAGILSAFSALGMKTDSPVMVMALRMGSYAIGAAVQAAVGIIIIVKSRKIAEYWFKNDNE